MKLFLGISLMVLFTSDLNAQNRKSIGGISFFSIIVKNIDTSIHWYSDILGFVVQNKVEDKERGFRQANLRFKKTNLELIETRNSLEADFEASNAILKGFFKIGFTIKNFDSQIEQLIKKGVKFRGQVVADPSSGKKMVILLDPDGNRVQFFEK